MPLAFCQPCIRTYLVIGSRRLHRQRTIKQKVCVERVVVMSKSEVQQQKLEQHVLLPTEEMTLKAWWSSLADDDDVEVCYPHEKHGLAGKTPKLMS